jgi:hypothetical protein
MHPIDLTIWLLSILRNPTLNPINVGSSRRITILELAESLRRFSSESKVTVVESDSQPTYYYPEIMNIKKYYNLSESIALEDGLEDWVRFLRDSNKLI